MSHKEKPASSVPTDIAVEKGFRVLHEGFFGANTRPTA
jgi:hypothetical protein